MHQTSIGGGEQIVRPRRNLISVVNVEMKKLSSVVFNVVIVLALIDLAILATALLQVAYGQGGYFAPFWRVQVEFIFNLLS